MEIKLNFKQKSHFKGSNVLALLIFLWKFTDKVAMCILCVCLTKKESQVIYFVYLTTLSIFSVQAAGVCMWNLTVTAHLHSVGCAVTCRHYVGVLIFRSKWALEPRATSVQGVTCPNRYNENWLAFDYDSSKEVLKRT